MIGFTGEDGGDQGGNIRWVMGAIGIEKDQNVTLRFGNTAPNGRAFASLIIDNYPRPTRRGNVTRAIGAVSIDDKQFIGMGPRSCQDG
jgi:hypothetical protein